MFQDIQFDVNAGEMLAVMGPSGIGKSMLSKAIALYARFNVGFRRYPLRGHQRK
ncbi:hypothetical protein JCM19239_7290 [Vibrio variabilis]|uniref:ABC transporter domain-containing protein n=1 Tax=Vibrio variabilis TaxID=990271 RepID=A0ABQ0J7D8_9VIBR|nr:hypothetical protein JCM19239_7290 [Vibrio variabilis]